MPKTRRKVKREAKVAEILESAEAGLREGGYAALSISRIARELGIAPNSVYWYFPSKDHLFVAVLQRMLGKIVARKPHHTSGPNKILWFVDQLHDLYPLRAALHERAVESDVAAEFERQLNEVLRRMLMGALSPYVPKKELPLAVDAFVATVQGSFTEGMKPADRKRILRFALDRLTTASR